LFSNKGGKRKVKVGLVTYKPELVEGFEIPVYYSKWADGQSYPAAKKMQNDVTCFCDAKAIRDDPSMVALSKNGPALRKNRRANLAFDFVCPTHPQYNAKVLEYIENLSKEDILGVTLNLNHFPEKEFCTCPRCQELHKKSGLSWTDWRAEVTTQFVRDAKAKVKGTFAVEIWPDPVLAKERFGLDLDAIGELVDYFHVPLSSRDYLTNYWVDLLVQDFCAILKKPVTLELSAEMPTDEKLDALLRAVAYVSRHNLDAVLFLVHDSENAKRIAQFAVHNSAFRDWLEKYEFTKMTQIVDNWAKIY
jgi:hypothetical protein